jgi:AraC-like DNA-binding protein
MKIQEKDLASAIEIKSLIEKNYSKHYTYDDLAHIGGTNKSTFQIAFKAVTKKNPYEFLTAIRMQNAMDLLTNSHASIKQVAGKVGLDKSNFSKQFKKFTGKTPTAWKKEQELKYLKENNRLYRSNIIIPPNLGNVPVKIYNVAFN